LGKLSAYARQNGLALALRELGRIECTIFTLKWLQKPALRGRVSAGVKKGELRKRPRARHLLSPPRRDPGTVF
jgi:TnpA family transposase